MTAPNIATQLETARKQLLDLSFRNPLLNYRPLKARGVEIISGDPDTIYQLLVADNKRFTFRDSGIDEAEGADGDGAPGSTLPAGDDVFERYFRELEGEKLSPPAHNAPAPKKAATPDTVLQTASTASDLQKRLLNTQYAARICLEEQGINTLYLALGMLTWYETEQPATPRRSPLILIPVTLERPTVSERFSLRYNGDEVGANASMDAQLRKDFGVALPPMPPAEDLSPSAYFEQVELLVGGKSRWEVDMDSTVLAFFSFNKITIDRDLASKEWAVDGFLERHPVIAALLGRGFHESASRFADDQRLDAVLPPTKTRTVVDADSSQMLAIEDVKQGRDIVIQGPPGTGKSQTITNIIAEAIGQGKTVLFVAEKQAALEVVKSRLDAIELGNACLELHSDKANKKAILTELKRTLALGKPVAGTVETDTALLVAAQERLNDYCEAVNSPLARSGKTLYDLYGEWLGLGTEAGDMVFPELTLPGCENWTPFDFREKEACTERLQAQLARMGSVPAHPFFGSRRLVFLPMEAPALTQLLRGALEKVAAARAEGDTLCAALSLPARGTPGEAAVLAQAVERAVEAPPSRGLRFGTGDWLARGAEMASLLERGERMSALKARFGADLVPKAWDTDVLAARQAVVAHGAKWYRFVDGDFRAAQKQLSLLCAGGVAPKDWNHSRELLDGILEYRRAKAEFAPGEPLGVLLFGAQWQGEASKWPVLRQLFDWITELHREVGDHKLPQAFLDFLAGSPRLDAAHTLARQSIAASAAASTAAREATRVLEWQSTAAGAPGLEAEPFATQEATLTQWAGNVDRLSEITTFNQLQKQMAAEGLAPLTDAALHWEYSARALTTLLRNVWYAALLRAAYAASPALSSFNGVAQEQTQAKFRALDTRFLFNNRVLLAKQHWDSLPRSSGQGQLGILTRQFELKTRHFPIRRLMEEAGNAIQTIKPVFMMSPLSVATYLAPNHLRFDLVVFDEASQVKPVDAFGALLRGRQAVVVGDSKQLPPSSFFDKLAMDDDEETEEGGGTNDIESVLGLFASRGAPSRMLKWHYRSRHESLIAVSNQEFYDNNLVIFPSPDGSREHLGLVLRYLPDTVYDRGRSGTNRKEAQAVADAVIAHARGQIAHPRSEWLTLGVAAFSMAQMQEIFLQVELKRQANPDCEPFFDRASREPFFVKNLENVQGDERDVIYISVGYGRDAFGRFGVNFGPLNRDGGERRLNVLITRARLRCEVFTNMLAGDIDLTRSSAKGVEVFRQFLAYARDGALSQSVPTGLAPDSPFEREVIAELVAVGYDVEPQMGCAGFRIDIAVRDPAHPGRYILGIECDGATYHSALSARDRDRLRESVLTRMGWRLHRIWSTDWFHRRAAEATRLRDAVAAAISAARENERTAPEPPPLAPPSVIIRVEESREVVPPQPYIMARLEPVMADHISELTPLGVSDLVVAVVAVESPVSVAEVAQRIAVALSVGRVTRQFRVAVESGCTFAVADGRICRRGEFLWLPGMQSPPLRDRAACPARLRQLDQIAPEEVAAAAARVVGDSYGIAREEIPRYVGKLFGIERITAEAKPAIDAVVAGLLGSGTLREKAGQVFAS